MAITYNDNRNIPAGQLGELFLSVGWLSGKYPLRLQKAVSGSDTVFAAWDGDRLVGIVNALDDGELTAYVHYLLVAPDYQKQGIGKKLLAMVKDKYRDYLSIVLTAEHEGLIDYYKACGFDLLKGGTPMARMNKN